MSFGFVYILGNEYMPDLIKIGCTERSPHARAEELSKPTGVPTPFRVLCYAEFSDFQALERKMHDWCKGSRVSDSREFFHGCLSRAVSLLWFHPARLSFTDATAGQRNPLLSELVHMACTAEDEFYFDDLWNYFSSKEENEARLTGKGAADSGDIGVLVPELDAAPELPPAANDSEGEARA